MQNFLIRRFVPQGEAGDPAVRRAYGQLAGGVGIALNALLCVAKMVAGLLSGSISVLSDAINNLSDMGSSLISIISARLSGRQPDPEHPFGHGRVEYVSSLIIAFLILFAGGQLLISSVQKLINPEEVTAGWPLLCVMVLSALVKLWMWAFNRKIGKRISSSVQLATARDSLNDCLITLTVAAATVIAVSTGEMRVDGGAVANNFLMQFQSDILGTRVERPEVREVTALGAAYLAGLAVGFWQNLDELQEKAVIEREFRPGIETTERNYRYAGWKKAVKRAMAWEEHDE